jgi:hypothetical protein
VKTNFIIRVYITECNDGIIENGMTITSFPVSRTQMSNIKEFLVGIYDEFRRQGLYKSTILWYNKRLRDRQQQADAETEESEYDYGADDLPKDHLFRDGPLPGDFTFKILEDDIRKNRVRRGHQVWLVDVCQRTNIWNCWRIVLEIV